MFNKFQISEKFQNPGIYGCGGLAKTCKIRDLFWNFCEHYSVSWPEPHKTL